jgi:penicillin amidase
VSVRRLGQIALALLLLIVAAGGWVWWQARASLPVTTGELALAGLGAPVRVERDALGIPVIRAQTLDDALRAQGFVHAQDRFFQMDLSRRATAGELAALFGARAVEGDRRLRPRQRRRAARQLLAGLDVPTRRLIDSYCAGVNAGLRALGAAPPEYLLLRAAPEPWLAEDTLLAVLGFFDMLSFNHRMEKPLGVMAATLPPALVEFLTPSTSRWDVPLIAGDPAAAPLGPGGYEPLPVPGADVVDLRGSPPVREALDFVQPTGMAVGSNNWAVAAAETATGHAILANDPHLGLRVPHVWHRVQFEVGDRRIVGVGAPGLPGVVIGSNGHLAWGATNSFADQTDLVIVEVDPVDPSRYLVADGSEPFTVEREVIAVRGEEPVELEVRWTRWGPVSDQDWLGRPLVVRSPVHDPGGLNFELLAAMTATTLEEGIAMAESWRGPSQNWLFAAADGRIAWVVNGPIPLRQGFSGKFPTSWVAADHGWLGERRGPQLVDPPEGRLWTANGRTVPQGELPLTHVWMHSGRTSRIHQLLAARSDWEERGLRRIQLDTASAYHDFAVALTYEVIPEGETDPVLSHFRQVVAGWDGTANTDQAGFVAVAHLAEAVVAGVLGPLLAPAVAADPDFVYDWALADEPVRLILDARPPHLVPPPHGSWAEFLRATLVTVAADLATAPGGLDRTWGEARPVTVRHPLSGLPVLGHYLDMPTLILPGWAGSVRAQTGRYGASMRMVVSPGHEESGLLHMPAGESGHFMSPHYADQLAAWAEGQPTPLLAGDPVTTLILVPAAPAG